MLKKIVFLAAIMALVWSGTSFGAGSTPVPPANGAYVAGWGMNPTDWQTATGTYNSGLALYDPDGLGGGAGWLTGWNAYTYISYAPITLELWIEMYMIQTYHYTSYQWHRLGNHAETIIFTIDGTVSSNEGCWVLCTKDPSWDPNYMTFVHNIGVGDDRNARDIPLTWRGRWGDGHIIGDNVVLTWTGLDWVGDELILAEVEACDTWFQFEGSFDIEYHEADGYYYCALAGCPAPTL